LLLHLARHGSCVRSVSSYAREDANPKQDPEQHDARDARTDDPLQHSLRVTQLALTASNYQQRTYRETCHARSRKQQRGTQHQAAKDEQHSQNSHGTPLLEWGRKVERLILAPPVSEGEGYPTR
jgi:hypothetical protein